METLAPELRDACVRAIVNLALVTGNVGKPSAGIYPLFSGANEQGARDVGCVPDYLPGGRRQLEKAWGVELPEGDGLSLKEIAPAVREGRVKALILFGDPRDFANGELADFVEAAKGLEFLVVQGAFADDLTEIADVVLPSATFAEVSGTYTNLERRVQLLRPVLVPKDEEDADWRIISRIARRMGADGFDHQDAESVFDEITGLVINYGGITYERLRSGGLQWPCLAADMADTPFLYAGGGNAHKANLVSMTLAAHHPHSDVDYPYLLARGRVLHQSDRTMEIRKAGKRNEIRRHEVLELHEDDATTIGVEAGDWVEVVSAGRSVRGVVQLSSPHKGLIATTALFGQLISELDASSEPDPMLKVEGLPLVPVRVEKVAEEAAD